MTLRRIAASGSRVTGVKVGRIPLIRQDNGDHGCGMRGLFPALLETLRTQVPQCIILTAYMKVMAMP